MKKISILIIALASGQCFANSWYGASDIKKESYVTPGVKGGFSKVVITEKKLTPKKIEGIKKKALLQKAMYGAINVSAHAENSWGRVGQYTTVRGSHKACFYNTDDRPAQGGYRFTLAAMGNTALRADTFSISGKSEKCFSTASFMSVYPRGSGTTPITSYTVGNMNYRTEDTHDNATLTVN